MGSIFAKLLLAIVDMSFALSAWEWPIKKVHIASVLIKILSKNQRRIKWHANQCQFKMNFKPWFILIFELIYGKIIQFINNYIINIILKSYIKMRKTDSLKSQSKDYLGYVMRSTLNKGM